MLLVELPHSSFLDLAREGDQIVFSLKRCFAEHFGLGLRRAETLRCVKKCLHQLGPFTRSESGSELSVPYDATRIGALAEALEQVERDLKIIAERPLTSRLVQEALGITGRERMRWTKDGRLSSSGTYTILRQQVITLSAYSVDYIRDLAAQPSLVDEWRAADKKAVSFDRT